MARRTWLLTLAGAAALTGTVLVQGRDAPRNDLPQPYRTTRDWGQLPAGMTWAAVTAVESTPEGAIYVVHRCFANSCAGRKEAPILKFDANGKLLKSWGEGLFIFPHGATSDRDGNLWVTDAGGGNGRGHQVFKFSSDGQVLMTLGQAGVSGAGPNLFDQPTDVVIAPNGDIFVTDSHRNGRNNRVVRFSKDGRFLKEWGRKGSGPGDTGAHELTGIRKGVRIGSARDGQVTAFIEDSESTASDHSGAEGIGVDAQGNVYGGVVRRQMLERHVKK